MLGAEADHIAPWRATYRTTQIVGGDARFTLTSSGHIAGVVNPPEGAKAMHWVRDDCPADADEWMTGATQLQGSWWLDWLGWAKSRSGAWVAPPKLPEGEPAPGSYVRGLSGPPVPGTGAIAAGKRNTQTNGPHSRSSAPVDRSGIATRAKRA